MVLPMQLRCTVCANSGVPQPSMTSGEGQRTSGASITVQLASKRTTDWRDLASSSCSRILNWNFVPSGSMCLCVTNVGHHGDGGDRGKTCKQTKSWPPVLRYITWLIALLCECRGLANQFTGVLSNTLTQIFGVRKYLRPECTVLDYG